MKKIILSACFAALFLAGCSSKNKGGQSDSTTTETTTEATEQTNTSPANEPKTYSVTFTPDSALLGKSKEAQVKVLAGTAIELADPDGKSQGIELTFKISVTNRNKVGSDIIGVSPADFRLMLDNNTSISETSGSYVSINPESTSESENIIYRIPAGVKPKALNLFYNETRASVGVELK